MTKTKSKQLLFYQKLGELFYAVAAADKVVTKEEYEVLTQLVEEQWRHMDNHADASQVDAAYQISIVFEWFDYERMDAEDCFESFSDYYINHKELFTIKRKKLILKTIGEIADSFGGKNKSELIMLAKTQLLFKNS